VNNLKRGFQNGLLFFRNGLKFIAALKYVAWIQLNLDTLFLCFSKGVNPLVLNWMMLLVGFF